MNKNSNTYIIIYASVMVIVVAAVLAYTSMSLQGRQNENVRIEKMGDILGTIGQGGDAATVKDKAAYITELYNKYVTDTYAVDHSGNRVEGADAFQILTDLKAEYDKPVEERRLPVFESTDDQGTVSYVLPFWGTGLWGPVWGYIALADDWDTVEGVVLDHKGETPGLGAEISTTEFESQFKGKRALDDGGKVQSIVLKKGGMSGDDPYAVDAITGGTLTSIGVENMLRDGLNGYQAYIDRQLAAKGTRAPEAVGTDESATPAQTEEGSLNVNSEGDEQ